jgi:hypothetical protein
MTTAIAPERKILGHIRAVVPAKAGTQESSPGASRGERTEWILAFAGMTGAGFFRQNDDGVGFRRAEAGIQEHRPPTDGSHTLAQPAA